MVGTMAFTFSNIDFGDDGGRRCEHGSWFLCKCESRLVDIFDERYARVEFWMFYPCYWVSGGSILTCTPSVLLVPVVFCFNGL